VASQGNISQSLIRKKVRSRLGDSDKIVEVTSGECGRPIVKLLPDYFLVRHELYRAIHSLDLLLDWREIGKYGGDGKEIDFALGVFETQVICLLVVSQDIVRISFIKPWRQIGKVLNVVDEKIDVPAMSMTIPQHQHRTTAPGPFVSAEANGFEPRDSAAD
jgi:hypothetical protein